MPSSSLLVDPSELPAGTLGITHGTGELRKRVTRWLVLPIGLGLAATAAYVLLTGQPPLSSPAPGPPVHQEISQQSRDQLREILRDAEETR